jgi:hypothetical protein
VSAQPVPFLRRTRIRGFRSIADATTLFLPAAARWLPFAPIHAALRGIAFHALDLGAMRRAQPRVGQAVAISDGTLAAAGLLTALFQSGTWEGAQELSA